MRGRRWVFDRAHSGEHAGTKPTDYDILDLHGVMFGDFLGSAGTTRRDDAAPAQNRGVVARGTEPDSRSCGLDR